MQMSQLAMNAIGDDLEAAAEFCRAEGIGIEVTAFAFPAVLDGDIGPEIDRHLRAVAGITPLISHGPFYDLVVTSPDPAIIDVARRRHEAALDASHEIGATFYIAHTNFTPIIRNPAYRDNWAGRMLKFWLPLADRAGRQGITICLENLWEPGPDIQADLIAKGGHPHLRATFDNGHLLVFTDYSARAWIETLGGDIAHCHVHDNNGELDEHLPVGEGKENWPDLLDALGRHAPDAPIVAETDRFDRNRVSIERLKELL
jgi:sugar phosphate isomerase/epimerase